MDAAEQAEDRMIDEEYRVWKKNSPFLYDLVMTHALEWPSLTVQWMNEVSRPTDRDVSVHKMLLGTHTSNGEPNHVMIADVCLPLPGTEIDARKYDDEKGEVGGFGGTLSKIDIKIKMVHEGEVNRARVMPQNNFIIATKSPSPNVFVFDYSKHSSMPTDMVSRPQHRCLGHTAEGYGLAWNPLTAGELLSGSDDSAVCLWDVNQGGLELQAKHIFKGHTDVVEDVDWSKHHAHLFASVGDDKQLILWDLRNGSGTGAAPKLAVQNSHGDSAEVNCVAFNPLNEFLLATGGCDNAVRIWDMRKMSQSIHTCEGHRDGVFQVEWAPFSEHILGSSGADRRVNIWDLSRIGMEQNEEDAEDGPPELLFGHGGHTAKVSDFSWCCSPTDEWTIASVAEDNVLQVWQMASDMLEDDESDEEGSQDVGQDSKGKGGSNTLHDSDLEEPDEESAPVAKEDATAASTEDKEIESPTKRQKM